MKIHRKILSALAALLVVYVMAFVLLRLAFNTGVSFTHVQKAGPPRLIVRIGACFYPLSMFERDIVGTSGGIYHLNPDSPPFNKLEVGP